MKRRDFCVHSCQAVTLAAFGSLLQGCGGNPASPSGTAPALPIQNASATGNVVTLTIDASSPLATVGNAALVQSSAGVFLVACTAQNTFVALTATCTHQGCTITGYQNQTYVCPCHGSQFSTSGGVVGGPATISLRRYTTAFAGNVLTISA